MTPLEQARVDLKNFPQQAKALELLKDGTFDPKTVEAVAAYMNAMRAEGRMFANEFLAGALLNYRDEENT